MRIKNILDLYNKMVFQPRPEATVRRQSFWGEGELSASAVWSLCNSDKIEKPLNGCDNTQPPSHNRHTPGLVCWDWQCGVSESKIVCDLLKSEVLEYFISQSLWNERAFTPTKCKHLFLSVNNIHRTLCLSSMGKLSSPLEFEMLGKI